MDIRELDSSCVGVTSPAGFAAAGVAAGIKASGLDLALVTSEVPAVAAGTFTTNRIVAAPVVLCRAHLRAGPCRAVLINSGNANACTGAQGAADAARMAELAAESLGVRTEEVLVCSTGTIGVPLPMAAVETGIAGAAAALSPDGGFEAARAILTTDTVDKQAGYEVVVDGVPVRVGGMAKGAGMIEPHMATMLAVVTTDAAVDPGALQRCWSEAVAASFNRITVDGDCSTNDTALLLANGAAGNTPLTPEHLDWAPFASAVRRTAMDLARRIVRDGEGATRFVTVRVSGAASDEDAHRAARAIANSPLVKTSWYGSDPNWGRVLAAVGYSGAEVREDCVEICYDEVCAFREGAPRPDRLSQLEAVLARRDFAVRVDLHLGSGEAVVYTCDCSEEYVRINSAYTT